MPGPHTAAGVKKQRQYITIGWVWNLRSTLPITAGGIDEGCLLNILPLSPV